MRDFKVKTFNTINLAVGNLQLFVGKW